MRVHLCPYYMYLVLPASPVTTLSIASAEQYSPRSRGAADQCGTVTTIAPNGRSAFISEQGIFDMGWCGDCCVGNDDNSSEKIRETHATSSSASDSAKPKSVAASESKNPCLRTELSFQETTFVKLKKGLLLYGLAIVIVSHIFNGWVSVFTSPLYSHSDIPDLHGKFAVVTGANTGIGKQTVLELARKGCDVVLTSRNMEKGLAAVADINSQLQHEDSGRVRLIMDTIVFFSC